MVVVCYSENQTLINFTVFHKKIIGEGTWVASGHIATGLARLIGLRLLTQYVEPHVYGTVSLLLGILTLGEQLFCQPILLAALRFYSEMEGNIWKLRQIIKRYLFWTTTVLVIVLILGGGIWSIFKGTHFFSFLALAGLLLVETYRNVEYNFLIAERRQQPLAVLRSVEAWTRPFFAIGGVLVLGVAPQIVLGGYLSAESFVLLMLFLFVYRKGTKPNKETSNIPAYSDTKLIKSLRGYILPLVPLALVHWLNSLSDRYIIGGVLGMESVGIYAASYALIGASFMMVQSILGQTLQPLHFQAVSTNNISLEKKTFNIWLMGTVGLCVIGVLGVFLFKDSIAGLLLAEKFRSGSYLMPWLALGNAIFAMAMVYGSRLLAYKKTKQLLFSNMIGAVAAVVITIPMVYYLGLIGAAIACPCYFFVLLLSQIVMVKKFV